MTANALLFRILIGIVVLSPLPLASNRPIAWNAIAVLTGLLLLSWARATQLGRASPGLPQKSYLPLAYFFVPTTAFILLQYFSLFPAELANPLWQEGRAALGQMAQSQSSAPLSLAPEATMTSLIRWLSYAGIFFLSSQLARDRSRARLGLVAVALTGAGYAAYGLIVHFGGWQTILWFDKWAYLNDLTATFVNRNAYGAFAGMGMLACLGLFFHALRPSATGHGRGIRDLAEAIMLKALPYLVAALLLGTALLLTHSRGAFLATLAAIGVLIALLITAGMTRPRNAIILGVILAVAGIFVLGLSGDRTVERLAGSQSSEESRPDVYRLTGEAIADAPLTGHGYGAFAAAFQIYRDTTLNTDVVWDYAHNVFLETAMELGLPAAIAFFMTILMILILCLRGVRIRRRDHIYPILACSMGTLLGLHGVVDFSAQIPAIAVTFAFVLGLGYAQSWNTSPR